jgi:aryl-alcohol dehydrogenase-like predicted oxidoreductase
MFEAVTVVIPGARNPRQALENVAAAGLPSLSDGVMHEVARIYVEDIKPHVHQRW